MADITNAQAKRTRDAEKAMGMPRHQGDGGPIGRRQTPPLGVDSFQVFAMEYLTVDQVARVLHVHRQRVAEWASLEDDPMPFRIFPGMQKGAFISRDDLIDWVDRNSIPLAEKGRGR
jgi:hypothetical protein